jgi:hypothetical protein
VIAAVTGVLHKLQQVGCCDSQTQLAAVFHLLGDWLTLQRPTKAGAFYCRRAADNAEKPATLQHVQAFAAFGCKSLNKVSSVLHASTIDTGIMEAGDTYITKHIELSSLLLVNAALEGLWLSSSAAQEWTRVLQAGILRDDALFGAMWDQALAMLQVRSCCACENQQCCWHACIKHEWLSPCNPWGRIALDYAADNDAIACRAQHSGTSAQTQATWHSSAAWTPAMTTAHLPLDSDARNCSAPSHNMHTA